jgi:hypothetical protein
MSTPVSSGYYGTAEAIFYVSKQYPPRLAERTVKGVAGSTTAAWTGSILTNTA